LLEAAQFTGLEIEIPSQPSEWPIESLNRLGSRMPKPDSGPAFCWLGHLHVLQKVVDHSWATSLIVEDDVDWDIAIKTQVMLIAPLVEEITGAKHRTQWPYGKEWDLLWLGHCGDNIPAADILAIRDITLPPAGQYRDFYGDEVKFPVFTRMVHKSVSPVCTFAYAVTSESAARIIELTKNGGEGSISSMLRRLCQEQALRCITVNPELFHHHKSAGHFSSEIGIVQNWRNAEQPVERDFTPNIRYSARCNSKTAHLVECRDATDIAA
jgi:hypothetical protein